MKKINRRGRSEGGVPFRTAPDARAPPGPPPGASPAGKRELGGEPQNWGGLEIRGAPQKEEGWDLEGFSPKKGGCGVRGIHPPPKKKEEDLGGFTPK